jgi:acyl-CoA synthetase (NDP forming)
MEGKADEWKRDLTPLLNPRSVAFVGISGGPRPGMAGGCIKNLQKFGYGGKIFPVNPKYEEIMGFKCYKNLAQIPEEIDLVLMAIPVEGVLDVIRDAAAKKVKAAIIYAGGFAETGEKGKQMQMELARICEEKQIRLCGPNNLGVLSFREKAMVYANHIPPEMKAGGFGYVGQSGSIMMCALAAAT